LRVEIRRAAGDVSGGCADCLPKVRYGEYLSGDLTVRGHRWGWCDRGQRWIVWLLHTLRVVRNLQEQVHGLAELHRDDLSEPLPTSGSGSFHTKNVSTSPGAAV
jgi:hypothetical protein